MEAVFRKDEDMREQIANQRQKKKRGLAVMLKREKSKNRVNHQSHERKEQNKGNAQQNRRGDIAKQIVGVKIDQHALLQPEEKAQAIKRQRNESLRRLPDKIQALSASQFHRVARHP